MSYPQPSELTVKVRTDPRERDKDYGVDVAGTYSELATHLRAVADVLDTYGHKPPETHKTVNIPSIRAGFLVGHWSIK